MKNIFKKKAVKKVEKKEEKKVTSAYPVGYDPDMPENKQRHLR